jgi:hypothetical protein
MAKDSGAGGRQDNLSTEHQEPGDAGKPSDTLNRPKEKTHAPREYEPAEDAGKAEPND